MVDFRWPGHILKTYDIFTIIITWGTCLLKNYFTCISIKNDFSNKSCKIRHMIGVNKNYIMNDNRNKATFNSYMHVLSKSQPILKAGSLCLFGLKSPVAHYICINRKCIVGLDKVFKTFFCVTYNKRIYKANYSWN